MKKAISVLLFILICVSVIPTVLATGIDNRIYSDSSSISDNELIVTVKIRNNCGIMGFKLIFTYDKNILQPERAVNGLEIKNGLFNDSISASGDGEFSVLWSSTADVLSDGEIAELHFKIKSIPESRNTTIKVTYSQPDTFNEKWEDVKLNCEDIIVKLSDPKVSTVTEKEVIISNETVFAKAVEAALKEVGEESPDKVPVEKINSFSEKVKSELKKSTSEYDNMSSDEILSLAKSVKSEKKHIETVKNAKKHYLLVFIIAFVLIAATVIAVLYIKKHKNGGNVNEEKY